MGNYINSDNGGYYEGDRRPRSNDQEVNQRPSPNHVHDGSKWGLDKPMARAMAKDAILGAAQEKAADFFADVTPARIRSELTLFKSNLQAATTQIQIDTVRDGAIAAIEAL